MPPLIRREWLVLLAAPVGAFTAVAAAYAATAFFATAITAAAALTAVALRRQIAYLVDAKTLAFALFLTAGYLKADPRLGWLPFDLTVAAGVMAVGFALLSLVRTGLPLVPTALLAALFVLYLPAVGWMGSTIYAEEKVARLFTATVAAAFGALLLIRTPNDARRFMNGIALVGVIMAADAAMTLATGEVFTGGVTAFGSNTIALGRASGAALVWMFVAALAGYGRLPVVLPLIGLCAVALASSGSSGPALTTLGVVMFVTFVAGSGWRRVGMAAAAALALAAAIAFAPEAAVARIEPLLGGTLNLSELVRLEAYQESLRVIAETPLGIGWGNFPSEITVGLFQYPHNLVLEVFLEAGWLGGIATLTVMSAALLRAFRSRQTPEGLGVFAVLAFLTVNAMVSGDVNDNRPFFAFMAIAVAHTSLGQR